MKAEDDDDDEVDLFGSDEEEDAAAEALKAERVAAYNAKKAQKPKTIAKVRLCSINRLLLKCTSVLHVHTRLRKLY